MEARNPERLELFNEALQSLLSKLVSDALPHHLHCNLETFGSFRAGLHLPGSTYFDSLQNEASFVTTTNDPAGFTLVDTLAWGALGHALGFAILAASSSGVIPGVAGP
eukprot:gene1547-1886_t